MQTEPPPGTIEPEALDLGGAVAKLGGQDYLLASIALSLKRIADRLDKMPEAGELRAAMHEVTKAILDGT